MATKCTELSVALCRSIFAPVSDPKSTPRGIGKIEESDFSSVQFSQSVQLVSDFSCSVAPAGLAASLGDGEAVLGIVDGSKMHRSLRCPL